MSSARYVKERLVKATLVPLPAGSKRRHLAKRVYKRLKRERPESATVTYQDWILRVEPRLWNRSSTRTKGPLISIVVPCYNTPLKYLKPLVESVLAQTYSNWQLCLADGSSDSAAKHRIRGFAAQDKRISYVPIARNFGIVGNTNAGIQQAKGEFVAFLDHDDTLSEYALAEIVAMLAKEPDLDLLYSDEDKLSDNGKKRLSPFFKPDWSPELLLGVNYITHLIVVRRSLLKKLGGLAKGYDGAQDYELLLRLTEQTARIKHIPKVLYHWRLADGSTAKNVEEKDYADTAGRRALTAAVKRRQLKASVVEIPERPTNYRLKFKLPVHQPKVSIIIPFKDKATLLKQCVESILSKSTYRNYEIILVSNNSTEKATHAYLDLLKGQKRCRIFTWNHPFNFSKINNYGRTKASGEYLVLLNNDTEVITPEWLEELVGVASQPGIGAVGPLLYYPDKTIQHAGIVLGMNTMAGHVFRFRSPNDWTDFGLPAWPRNYLAVTAACLAIKVSTYDEIGGLDETFTVAGNDVAFGISLYENGYRNVYWPFAELLHHENMSVGSYNNGIQLDYDHSLKYYKPYLKWRDPYFNANLDLMNEQIGLRRSYE